MKNRLAQGGLVDRSQLINFTYDGKEFQGFSGDTLASALLANQVHLVNRSFKYHRPRGIFTAGAEEPNALVQLEKGAYTTPNSVATTQTLYKDLSARSQNCFPNVNHDFGAINSFFSHLLPSGFYYKTFMWPAFAWRYYEYFIRKMAGLGIASSQPDPDRYESQHDHPDLVIVGGGIAGLMAAHLAAQTQARIVLIEQDCEFGGSLIGSQIQIDGELVDMWCRNILADLKTKPNVKILTRTVLFGYYNHNYLTASQRLTHHLPPKMARQQNLLRERLWHFRARHVILATGAIERPMVYANNDLPGTMLASAVGTYIRRFAVLPGKNIVFATNNDFTYRDVIIAHQAGAKVTLCDIRDLTNNEVAAEARQAGILIYDRTALIEAVGKKSVEGAYLVSINSDLTQFTSKPFLLPADLIGISGGYTPCVHLHSQARGTLKYSELTGAFVPDLSVQKHSSIGSANGTYRISETLEEAYQVTSKILKELKFKVKIKTVPKAEELKLSLPLNFSEMPHKTPHMIKAFIDFQNDSTANDVRLAMREGMISVEHVKRYTTTGMATDQGKTSNINALSIIAKQQNKKMAEIGYTTYRQPYIPVTFGAIAGAHRNELFMPERVTPIHPAHLALKAKFEPVGDWMRAWYYPKKSKESLRKSLKRECLAVRKSVGMFDASTLGKIDIQGEDSAWLLDMLYTNAWEKLAIGRCRYGIMLNEHGMIIDDGVTTRLGEHHYHMTTTTGGAARIMDWIELWLQTEWPEKKVYANSVTEQWGVVAIAGPYARDVMAKLTETSMSDQDFPFMSVKNAVVAGINARIYRITFSGELCFEINVPARYALALWQAIQEAGKEFKIVPYGTETMHVLRAEKGFIIVGQDTDGSCTPADMNMDWIVSKKKVDFIGKRSLARSDTKRQDRKQLVGLVTSPKSFVIPEGSQITQTPVKKPPYPMIGHVSSSYYSPILRQGIALALIKNGLQRKGEKVYIPLLNGRIISAQITDSVFYDKEGKNARL